MTEFNITYCSKCLLPSTKPDLKFVNGVCSACLNFEGRSVIDFESRAKEFVELVKERSSKSESKWDCLIPVSGGKDSTYQVLKILELGFNPLCVTATTCDLSSIGRENIENIKQLGVDYIEFSPNKIVRRKLNKIGLTMVGDIAWPEHVGIFTIPVVMALKFKIPTLIWGENSQNEYGGPDDASNTHKLDRRWLEEFGGLIGLRVSDLIGILDLTEIDLAPYAYPSASELEEGQGILGIFLGHYFPWDGLDNYLIAKAHGLKTPNSVVEGSMVDYENLDNLQHGIHDYFKFLKYGYGRATDQVSMHIRRGRINRAVGLDIVKRVEGKFPASYLGVPLKQILDRIEVTEEEFKNICKKFTNTNLFKKDINSNFLMDSNGNLIKVNYDNP
jgi:N-acetyl sugar amidotransferase